MSLPRVWPAALVVIGCAWNLAMAQQKTAVEVGVLACSFSQSGRVETRRTGVEIQVRDILCSFKLRSGAEETYTGKLLGVSLSAEHKGTLLWLVMTPSAATPPAPGLLQQSYAADAKAPADQIPDMIGEANSDIVLQSMADHSEGFRGFRILPCNRTRISPCEEDRCDPRWAAPSSFGQTLAPRVE